MLVAKQLTLAIDFPTTKKPNPNPNKKINK